MRHFHHISKTARRAQMTSKFGPPVNRAMVELDREFFRKLVPLTVAYFPQPRFLGQFVKQCKHDILNMPSVKHIVHITPEQKGVLLRPDLELCDEAAVAAALAPLTLAKIKEFGVEVQPYTLQLDYSFWKADDILRAVLPELLAADIPTGFAQAGHVAHLNLRDEFKPYGRLIGQVLIDKNSKVETVVDKVDTIDTKFRTFKMQVLAGRDDLVVEQSESGCRFVFDFSKVYWNSRLNSEHERLIAEFEPRQVVADVFAGVGPFAVPAGKKLVMVMANDLNPHLYRYLQQNIEANKVGGFVRPFNLDGREFIRQSPRLLVDWAASAKTVERKVKRRRLAGDTGADTGVASGGASGAASGARMEVEAVPIPQHISHYVMNLPDSALTFLDEFVGLYSRDPAVEAAVRTLPGFRLPTIHVHCFEKFLPEGPEPTAAELHRRVHARITALLNHALPIEQCRFHLVRKVAPTKPMFCVSFELPAAVAFHKPPKSTNA